MIGRPANDQVAAHPEVPKTDEGTRAGAGAGLGRNGCVGKGIEQPDEVLLILPSRTGARYADVERAILEDQITKQKRVREGPAL